MFTKIIKPSIVALGLSALCFNLGMAASQKPILNIKHWRLKNGAEVYFVKESQLPMVDIAVAFNAGSAHDGSTPGLANLTSSMLNEGAANLNTNQIANDLADTGAEFNSSTDRDLSVVALRTLTKAQVYGPAVDLFTKILNQPTFPDKAFKRVQRNTLTALKVQQQTPQAIASIAFMKALYGNSAYGHAIIGNVKSVSHLTPQQLKRFYHQYYVGNNAIVAIVGDVTLHQAQNLADKVAGQLPAGEKAATIMSAPTSKAALETIDYPSTQSYIRMGELGIARNNPQYFPLMVGNYILGGDTVSRLFTTVREKYGLSYGVWSFFQPLAKPGPFVIMLQTKNQTRSQAIKITQKVLQNFLQKGPSAAELQNAKRHLIGGFPFSIANNANILQILVNIGYYDLPLNYLDTYKQNIYKITSSEIKKAFDQTVSLKRLIIVSVGGKT